MLVSAKVHDRLAAAVDARAAALGVPRSTVIRSLLADGLMRPAGPGGDALPAGPVERMEAVRETLWRQAQAGSTPAAAALERSLARDVPVAPAPADAGQEFDQLRAARLAREAAS